MPPIVVNGDTELLYLFETPHNRRITWNHLLRQTSDWEGTLWGKPDWADRPGDKPQEWLTRKRNAPGTSYKYNDVRVNVFALALLNVWRRPLPAVPAILTGIQFGLLVLGLNILLLPSFFFGIGAITMLIANAYLLSREYFEMAAMRHLAVADARKLRKEHSPQVFLAGLLPAVLALIPIVNLVVPLYATSYFVHIFKQVRGSSA